MMRIVATVVLSFLAFSTSAAERFVTTKGEATVEIPPDFVKIEMSLFSIGNELRSLKDDIDTRTYAVLAAAAKAGIAGPDIESGGVSVSREYETDRNDNDVLRGYRVNRTIAVKLRNISGYEQFAQDLIEAKVDEINEVEVDLNNPAELNRRALIAATRNAREEAGAIASELSIQLGMPLEVSENALWVGKELRERAGNLEEIMVTAQRLSAAPAVRLVFQPHAIEAKATVWARFEILGKSAP